MVRNNTWPSPGVGSAYSSTRKSDALGSPTGRETRTTRLAWDILVSSDFIYSDDSIAQKCRPILRRDFCQRRVERRRRARQVLEGPDQPRFLRVLFRNPRSHFHKRLAALDHRGRTADVKLVGLDRRVLQQPDAQRHDVVAEPIGNVAVDRDRTVALRPAELGIALAIQQLVRTKPLNAGRLRLRCLLRQIVLF